MFVKSRTGWKQRENQDAWLDKVLGTLEMKEKPIQNTNRTRQGHISNSPFHWPLRCSQTMAAACLPAEEKADTFLPTSTRFYYIPFLFHSFAVWGWGKLKFRSHSDPSCRAVVGALIKNPKWNRSQLAEALQPRFTGKKKKNVSSYFSNTKFHQRVRVTTKKRTGFFWTWMEGWFCKAQQRLQ